MRWARIKKNDQTEDPGKEHLHGATPVPGERLRVLDAASDMAHGDIVLPERPRMRLGLKAYNNLGPRAQTAWVLGPRVDIMAPILGIIDL